MAATILCADNDRSFCQILAKALGGAGYRVQLAHDGESAISAMSGADPPDLILIDVLLPRCDGFEVLGAIRNLEGVAAATPALMLSGCLPSPSYLERTAALGAASFLTKPVPLDELLESVAALTREVKPATPIEVETHTNTGALFGDLERLSFPALLHHLHGLRATGVLYLEEGPRRKWIQFRSGYPTAVRSNLVNECLGNYLVRIGRISQAIFDQSYPRAGTGKRHGEILVGMDVLSEEELSDTVRRQGDEKLFEIFEWESGQFRFEIGARLQRANSFGVEGSPANLILQGVRTRVPIARIRSFLDSQRESHVAPAASPFYSFQEIDLDSEEREWVARLDGTRRLVDLVDRNEHNERTLYALIATGMVELRSQSADIAQEAIPRAHPPARRGPVRVTRASEERSRLMGMADRMRDQTHWEILGVGEDATEEEIRWAHSRMAERTHPDRVGGAGGAVEKLAQEVFERVSVAYQTLIDPRRKQEYTLGQRRARREAREREAGRRALVAEQHFQLGEEHLERRQYPDALAAFGKALEVYPDDGEYHAHYGWALHLCHPDDSAIFQEALEHVRKGVKLAADREKPYLFLGRLCRATDRFNAAESMFSRAIQIRPDCLEAQRELRLIRMRRRNSRSERAKALIGRILRR